MQYAACRQRASQRSVAQSQAAPALFSLGRRILNYSVLLSLIQYVPAVVTAVVIGFIHRQRQPDIQRSTASSGRPGSSECFPDTCPDMMSNSWFLGGCYPNTRRFPIGCWSYEQPFFGKTFCAARNINGPPTSNPLPLGTAGYRRTTLHRLAIYNFTKYFYMLNDWFRIRASLICPLQNLQSMARHLLKGLGNGSQFGHDIFR